MHSFKQLFVPSFVCVVLGTLVGCGEPKPPYGTVTGSVTFEGKPVSNAIISFVAPSIPGINGGGPLKDGQFRAEYLLPGVYQVSISPTNDGPNEMKIGVKIPNPNDRVDVPKRYRDPEQSGLEVNVIAKTVTTFNVEMTKDK